MPPSKTRFVTACQQLLALGAVVAVLAPAAEVVDLDVVHEVPGQSTTRPVAALAAYARVAHRPSLVPTEAVEPTVEELALTAPEGTRSRATAAGPAAARVAVGAASAPVAVTSAPRPVDGFGAIGVTWDPDAQVPEEDIVLRARTREGGTWSDWVELSYHVEHAPDPDSPEARTARPGTTELLVGDVDEVQVKAVSQDGPLPADMRLAIVEPGTAADSTMQQAAIDTAGTDPGTDPATDPSTEPGSGGDGLALQAATYTPRPTIYSRAQWGANEKLRDPRSLNYHEVHAGFVHHTVNANDYRPAEVPGIIRSIYAYHTQSRGWSDIGYNFLVDKFGRIWEGRYGGVDRPVVGAHTQGYNDYSFAMSAIGNFETAKPRQAMLEAYGALMGWKLSLHGVSAGSAAQRVGSKTFRAINGHRDADSTACPGKYLYARIPTIRALAAQAQKGWAGRELESNLAGSGHPDVLARRASDGRVFVLPTAGLTSFPTRRTAGSGSYRSIVATPDVTGDERTDLIAIDAQGQGLIRPGNGAGSFARAVRTIARLAGHDRVTAAGDLNRDGRNDLVARRTSDQLLVAFLGNGRGGFRVRSTGVSGKGLRALAGAGDLDRDGRVDLVARTAGGKIWRYPSTRGARLGTPVQVATWPSVRTITGFGDYTRDGLTDVFVTDTAGNGYVMAGRGNGTFGSALGPVATVRGLAGVTGGGNVVGSAAPDLVARSGTSIVTVENAGTTELAAPIDTGLVLRNVRRILNVGDWDRDGYSDLVQLNTAGNLHLRRGNGRGRFGAPIAIGSGFSRVGKLAAVGDITGDGWPDLMGQPRGSGMRIYPGRGTKGLGAGFAAYSAVPGTSFTGVGRWDGDGAPDSLVRRSGVAYLYPSNGPGGLTGGRSLGVNLAAYDRIVGVRDADGDGHADLIAREKATGILWLLPGRTTGVGPRRELGRGMGVYDLMG